MHGPTQRNIHVWVAHIELYGLIIILKIIIMIIIITEFEEDTEVGVDPEELWEEKGENDQNRLYEMLK